MKEGANDHFDILANVKRRKAERRKLAAALAEAAAEESFSLPTPAIAPEIPPPPVYCMMTSGPIPQQQMPQLLVSSNLQSSRDTVMSFSSLKEVINTG